jgi:hypothetical protein
MSEDRLEKALEAMKQENVTPAEVAAAQERVWRKLLETPSTLCTGFRAELSEYLAGRLAESQRLLLEDHLGRCPDCRHALAEAKGEAKVIAMPEPGSRARRPLLSQKWARWAVAAGVAIVALYLTRDRLDTALAPSGPRATVERVTGGLYTLDGRTLAGGATLSEAQVVRTAAGARVKLRLADGSGVEMNERTELAVRGAWSGATIQLERGDVIVQAAKQRRGRLRVVTRDSVASVKGTIFAVSTGTAGSVVSVVEGAVEVEQPGVTKIVKSGEQASTGARLANADVRAAVSWSEDREKYYALLAEFAQIARQVEAASTPVPRTEGRLVPYLPADPLVYFAAPNLGDTAYQAQRAIEQRAQESDVLREWWESDSGKAMKKALETVQTLSPMFGDELVLVLVKDPAQNGKMIPLAMAEVRPGSQAMLKQKLDELFAPSEQKPGYQVTDKLLTVSDSTAHLTTLLAGLGRGASSAFAQEILARYQSGVTWLLAVDVAAQGLLPHADEAAAVSGTGQMKYLVLERRRVQGEDENEATVTFSGQRTGIASWLAEPGSSGSAAYVTSDSVFVLSASTKSPRQAFEEMISTLSRVKPAIQSELRSTETKTGVNVASDIAGALGTDFTLSIERPTVPIPGWVLVAEVYQPAALDAAVERFTGAFNSELPADAQNRKLAVTQETENGRTWNVLKVGSSGLDVQWTYDRGYMVMSMDRGLAAQAIATRNGGFTLVNSARFRSQMPVTATVHSSAFVWVNPQGALAQLSSLAPSPALKSLMETREPVLVVMDADTERIHAASRSRWMSLVIETMLAGSASHVQAQAKSETNAARD